MKKVISLLLAVLMAFSFVTVAFAEDAAAPEDVEATAPAEGEGNFTDNIDLGEYQWILDLPFWTVGPALKFAKIAIKLVAVYLKVAKIFGLVDQDMEDMILEAIMGMIENSQNAENGEDVTETPVVDESTTLAA